MHEGATATGTPMILASGSSIPIQKVVDERRRPTLVAVLSDPEPRRGRDQIELSQANGA